jgi:hypothetical protein
MWRASVAALHGRTGRGVHDRPRKTFYLPDRKMDASDARLGERNSV